MANTKHPSEKVIKQAETLEDAKKKKEVEKESLPKITPDNRPSPQMEPIEKNVEDKAEGRKNGPTVFEEKGDFKAAETDAEMVKSAAKQPEKPKETSENVPPGEEQENKTLEEDMRELTKHVEETGSKDPVKENEEAQRKEEEKRAKENAPKDEKKPGMLSKMVDKLTANFKSDDKKLSHETLQKNDIKARKRLLGKGVVENLEEGVLKLYRRDDNRTFGGSQVTIDSLKYYGKIDAKGTLKELPNINILVTESAKDGELTPL